MAGKNEDLAKQQPEDEEFNLSDFELPEERAEGQVQEEPPEEEWYPVDLEGLEEPVEAAAETKVWPGLDQIVEERAKTHPEEEWIMNNFEMEAGVALNEEIRGRIAQVLSGEGDPRTALENLKSDLAKNPEEALGAPVVQKIIDYYQSQEPNPEDIELSSIDNLDELKSAIANTLSDAVILAARTSDTERARVSTKAAFRIHDIFAKLDYEIKLGYLTLELDDLQHWVDFFATALGFDEKVFGGIVKKYYVLAGGKSEEDKEVEQGPEKASESE